MMNKLDLNLLVMLNALLQEQSVAKAASRLHLSPSAMSRALTRLREVTGDPLLVRAGRDLVPSPRAEELRSQVASLVNEAEEILKPHEFVEVSKLKRTFIMRNHDGFVQNFGSTILNRVLKDASGVRVRFEPKRARISSALREGIADLETGVIGSDTSPELYSQSLFWDDFRGFVRLGHPLLSGKITAESLARYPHIVVSRRNTTEDNVTKALNQSAQSRTIAASVAVYSEAFELIRNSDLIGVAPFFYTGSLHHDLASFQLPFELAPIRISLLWHPRMHKDPAHRWFRTVVREAVLEKHSST